MKPFDSSRSKALLAALAAALVLIAAGWTAQGFYRKQLLARFRTELESRLVPYDNALTVAIHQRFARLGALKAFVQMDPATPRLDRDFTSFAQGLVAGTAGIRNVSIALGGVQRYVYPLEGNEGVLGHDLLHDSRASVLADVERAFQTGGVTLSGPYPLRQGGIGLVARQAVPAGDQSRDLVAMVIDLPPILKEAGLERVPPSLELALRDSSGRVFWGNTRVFTQQPVLYRLELPEGTWELAAIPAQGWAEILALPLMKFRMFLAVPGILAMLLVFLLVDRQARLGRAVRLRSAELAESLGRYEALFNHNADALFLLDREGRILDANRTALERYGHNREELNAMTAADLSPPELRPLVPERIQATLRESDHFEWRHQLRDGTEVDVEIRTHPLVLDGRACLLAAVRDVSGRKQTEAALRQSEERFRRALENIPDVVVIYGPDLRIRYINAATRAITGLPSSHFIGKREEELWPPEVYQTYLPTLTEALHTGTTRSIEADLTFPDGNARSLQITCVPLTDEAGTVLEVLGITHDLTERKQAERELKLHRDHLEKRVAERTKELRKIVKLLSGREIRMAELKQEIASLRARTEEHIEAAAPGKDPMRRQEPIG